MEILFDTQNIMRLLQGVLVTFSNRVYCDFFSLVFLGLFWDI